MMPSGMGCLSRAESRDRHGLARLLAERAGQLRLFGEKT